jgi:serine/threonine protein kinase
MQSSSNASENEIFVKSAVQEPLLARQSSQSSLGYERVKLLGVGGSGLVYLVERKLDSRQFALKVALKSLLRKINMRRYLVFCSSLHDQLTSCSSVVVYLIVEGRAQRQSDATTLSAL